ncbi:calcium-dependent protein kinase CDPK6 [Besnoitia besnoiti]|uniref:non-specific serine/threonine protein kinase n=1 Tax=Besnoitia besnoiti TaxID=94643 RepID=A0A2A9MNZ8_BESBE|nr:calcium-dependent protein kinase CDPK6 [Besnoitia besnoiti]PFH37490.1 calcium-dependent protein kinase CDPK6 [Besnoitia besnoiti]
MFHLPCRCASRLRDEKQTPLVFVTASSPLDHVPPRPPSSHRLPSAAPQVPPVASSHLPSGTRRCRRLSLEYPGAESAFVFATSGSKVRDERDEESQANSADAAERRKRNGTATARSTVSAIRISLPRDSLRFDEQSAARACSQEDATHPGALHPCPDWERARLPERGAPGLRKTPGEAGARKPEAGRRSGDASTAAWDLRQRILFGLPPVFKPVTKDHEPACDSEPPFASQKPAGRSSDPKPVGGSELKVLHDVGTDGKNRGFVRPAAYFVGKACEEGLGATVAPASRSEPSFVPRISLPSYAKNLGKEAKSSTAPFYEAVWCRPSADAARERDSAGAGESAIAGEEPPPTAASGSGKPLLYARRSPAEEANLSSGAFCWMSLMRQLVAAADSPSHPPCLLPSRRCHETLPVPAGPTSLAQPPPSYYLPASAPAYGGADSPRLPHASYNVNGLYCPSSRRFPPPRDPMRTLPRQYVFEPPPPSSAPPALRLPQADAYSPSSYPRFTADAAEASPAPYPPRAAYYSPSLYPHPTLYSPSAYPPAPPVATCAPTTRVLETAYFVPAPSHSRNAPCSPATVVTEAPQPSPARTYPQSPSDSRFTSASSNPPFSPSPQTLLARTQYPASPPESRETSASTALLEADSPPPPFPAAAADPPALAFASARAVGATPSLPSSAGRSPLGSPVGAQRPAQMYPSRTGSRVSPGASCPAGAAQSCRASLGLEGSPPPTAVEPRRRSLETGPSPEMIREKLHKVMDTPVNFKKSACASFKQFDSDGDGLLSFDDLRLLIARLCRNLQLPPVDDAVLQVIFTAFDSAKRKQLDMQDFCRLYWELLGRIRDKFYPTKKMLVRRSVFVGRRNLSESKKTIDDLFTFKRKLGAGAFGDVHLVEEKSSGLERVIKTVNKDRSQVPMEQIEAEIEVLKSLDHPNIIKIFEVFEDYHNMYIVMETCEGGELLERIVSAQARGKSLSECYVAELMKQMMNALAYFHSQHVVHKDLKPENILFQDKSPHSPIKIIDFGLAELFKSDEHSTNVAGTALYMAPEVFKRDVTVKCDVWSAGVVMYFLLSGCLPFTGTSLEEVQEKATYAEPNYALECRHLTPQAIDLLKRMLTKDPRQRPSASEVLKHVWFNQANTAEIQISPLMCDNMKRYMRQSHLKNALVNLMAHQLNVTGQQIRHINQIFRQLDKNGDGLLSHQELTEGLLEAGVPRWDINRILQSVDVDDSGNVSYTEFLAACYSWQETELNILWTAFQKIDKDGDGKISVREFCDLVLGHDNKLVPEEDMEGLVAQMDKNGDGLIDWDEFVAYMRHEE